MDVMPRLLLFIILPERVARKQRHVSLLVAASFAAVCSWRLQRELRLSRRAGSARTQSLQSAELLEDVRPGQTQGGVPV